MAQRNTILNRGLYDAVYRRAATLTAQFPIRTIHKVGTRLYRVTDKFYKGATVTALNARTVWNASSGEHRWTGKRAGGAAGKGGLYTSLHLDSLQAEHIYGNLQRMGWHRKGFVDLMDIPATQAGRDAYHGALVSKKIFVFELKHDITVIDLSLESRECQELIAEITKDDAVKKAMGSVGYSSGRDAYLSTGTVHDHSFTRAIGHVAADKFPKAGGLLVTCVRTDPEVSWNGPSDNVVLFGANGLPVESVRPKAETVFYKDKSGEMQQETKLL